MINVPFCSKHGTFCDSWPAAERLERNETFSTFFHGAWGNATEAGKKKRKTFQFVSSVPREQLLLAGGRVAGFLE
jgi:hypothetical protein